MKIHWCQHICLDACQILNRKLDAGQTYKRCFPLDRVNEEVKVAVFGVVTVNSGTERNRWGRTDGIGFAILRFFTLMRATDKSQYRKPDTGVLLTLESLARVSEKSALPQLDLDALPRNIPLRQAKRIPSLWYYPAEWNQLILWPVGPHLTDQYHEHLPIVQKVLELQQDKPLQYLCHFSHLKESGGYFEGVVV